MGFTDLEIEGNSEYLKLVAGTVAHFHILSRIPKKEKVHWKDDKKASCLGSDCELCAKGNKVKQRWQCDVFDRKDGQVKKFEFGSSIAGQLKALAEMLAESGSDIHQVDLKIKTTGSGLETEHTVMNVPMGESIALEILDKYDIAF